MITVDCTNAPVIKDQMLIHVADKLGALPILKSEKFILTNPDDSKSINKSDVLHAISDFLKSVNLQEDFQIIPKGDNIKIEPLDVKDMKERLENITVKKKELFFECAHCGFITQYETELKSHKLIHYI
ncbi:hypothetical protein [Nitrosarchaeum sp. AC2]|uniref:hypothetical protein n=1 Tax=Nitrosarchaeum sp. AC2 TaxID=2259673 RepID=UPI0015C7672D|nr:hypothetical protein [Nitrosarchaeum sp. AC2]QLH10854.1 hypothetical protein DSQ20_04735 [Nitrosarchaeum sp. AC2]